MNTDRHLIIGSNSFLAKALIDLLVLKKEPVVGVYHKNTNNLDRSVRHIPISCIDELKDEFDVVYIVSAYVPERGGHINQSQLLDVNASLVEVICQQFESAKVVLCSSVSVYNNTDELFDESNTTEPSNVYGKSKLKGEHIVKSHSRYAIVRISSIYGLQMKPLTFLPLVIKSAIESNKIRIFGNGKRLQNYIHVQDVANYLYTAGKSSENSVFLATDKRSYSNLEIAELIKKEIPSVAINFQGEDHSKSYMYNNIWTNSKLQIEPEKRLEDELKHLISWIKKTS